MIDLFILFLFLIAFSVLGILLGTITGIVPGIHPNNVAFILLSIAPLIVAELQFLNVFLPPDMVLVLVASTIVATSVANTFLNFIPATFIGAPEEDTVLAMLPSHQLLLEGRAYEAIVYSAIGSFGAIIFSFLFLIPFYFLFSVLDFYEIIRGGMLYILIAISTLLILTESLSEKMEAHQAILLSSFVFILSGFFGYVILEMPVHHAPLFFPATMLFPALTGLFGLSAILFSLLFIPEIPEQRIEEPVMEDEYGGIIKSVVAGSTFGTLVSFLPGVTSAHATVMAMLARRNRDPDQVIMTLSGVNTANAIFCIGTLFLILRPRSGTSVAISQLLNIPLWDRLIPPSALVYLLIAALIAAPFSFFITKYIGKQFALQFSKIPYRKMLIGTAIFLAVLVLLFTGLIGLLILLVGACIGLIPIYFGVRRSHCMGVLLLPIIVFLW